MRSRRRALIALGVLGVGAAVVWSGRSRWLDAGDPPAPAPRTPVDAGQVAALGRLEPGDGLLRLAGPSRPSLVLARLLVHEGDSVEAGQALATLDTLEEDEARVARLTAELASARAELARAEGLVHAGSTPPAQRDSLRYRVEAIAADLAGARAILASATVRAPVAGRVLTVHARSGERVGPAGILDLGETDRMYAVADVYETDVGGIRIGQRATVRSRAFPAPLHGTVERIGLKVGRLAQLGTDPAADVDARVVKVRVRLDEAPAAALTNQQVDVLIDVRAGTPAPVR